MFGLLKRVRYAPAASRRERDATRSAEEVHHGRSQCRHPIVAHWGGKGSQRDADLPGFRARNSRREIVGRALLRAHQDVAKSGG